ncbi:MAG: CDP-glucose 4,6-dehydratase [Sphingobacteriaceae bacterium]|nr:CDP-glucose 4,6-dehydratase [Sphingobacteriaceae bacterium]
MSIDLFQSIYKGKKVLVTGDTGFKGSWMCIWLKELGADVYGYALPPLTNHDNYVTTGLASKIHHQDGDIRDREKVQAYFDKVKPDFAFHLAAQPLVIDSYKNPHYNFETNLMGTVNFFEAVRHCPSVMVAVNVTTDKCYQNNEIDYGYKETDPMGGDDPYSASKGCSELITNSYIKSFFSKEGTAHIASGRAGNVIGGGDWADNRIIPDMIRAYQNSSDLVVRNPTSVRPWQFVLEPVFGYLRLGEKLYKHGKKFSGGWNFGPVPDETYNVNQVVAEVRKLIPQIKVTTPENLEKLHEAVLLQLDITKAMMQLDWKPRLNFEKTIAFTINGYLQELKAGTDVYAARLEQLKQYCN